MRSRSTDAKNDRYVKSRRRQSWKGIHVKHDRISLHKSSEPTVYGSDGTARDVDVNSRNKSDLAAQEPRCSTTRTQMREFPDAGSWKLGNKEFLTLAKRVRIPGSASSNDSLSKETVFMVQAEQQLLRRPTATLHLRRAGERKINQIHEQIVRLETIMNKSEWIMQCLHADVEEEEYYGIRTDDDDNLPSDQRRSDCGKGQVFAN